MVAPCLLGSIAFDMKHNRQRLVEVCKGERRFRNNCTDSQLQKPGN